MNTFPPCNCPAASHHCQLDTQRASEEGEEKFGENSYPLCKINEEVLKLYLALTEQWKYR